MVRVKYRYILAEILTEQYKNKLKLPLKEYDLKQAILAAVEQNHGDYGLACIHAGFSIKVYNPATRILILRVRRCAVLVLSTTLPLITTAGKIQLAFRTLRLTGTIRSAFKFLIDFDKKKLMELVSKHKISSEHEKQLSDMIMKCHKRLAKRKFEDQ
ncbi:uncharacterized protein LOC118198415 [Stegodyphus dumicola]|uniref:uncharacterized protein LOC118198415 n=1 Tax=Stegodyphus dumicola TaxID=202533 RepID=UPI0015B0E7B9|nr:uncharacterized protein LOC118198415 [Stegodyphus dumicola]